MWNLHAKDLVHFERGMFKIKPISVFIINIYYQNLQWEILRYRKKHN